LQTDIYKRVWNHEMVAMLIRLREEQGWRVPPARPAFSGQPGTRHATEEDVLRDRGSNFGLSVNVGDLIAPAGLYASDHDMFAFMINENVVIDDGSEGGLVRGFFLAGSEVGEKSIWFCGFKLRTVCGNHIVWGAEDILEIKLRHVGEVRRAFEQDAPRALKAYAQAGAAQEQAQINAARQKVLGAKKEDVLDTLVKAKASPELSRKRLGEAYDLAEQYADQDGSPRTVYGMVNGITRLSQQTPYADVRNTLDRAAGKVMKIAF